jgi:hypothetical protein
MTSLEQIERLQKLLAEGAITQEEFQALKKQAIAGEAIDHPAMGETQKTTVVTSTTTNAPEENIAQAERTHKVYGQRDFAPPVATKVVQAERTARTGNTGKVLGVLALLGIIGLLGWYFFLKPTDKIPPAKASTVDTTGLPYNLTTEAGADMEDPFELNELQVEEANKTSFKTYRGDNFSEPIAYPTEIVKPKEPVIAAVTPEKKTETATKKKGTTTDTATASTAMPLPSVTTTPKRSQEFASPEGDVSMFIHEEEGKASLAGKYREELNTIGGNKSVTYKLLKDDFFVVSGYKGDNVYYQKTVLKDGKLKTFYTEYPKSKKEKMDPVTVRMSRSFK